MLSVYIDWDADGFGAPGSADDVSAWVKNAAVALGFRGGSSVGLFASVAEIGECRLTLDNSDRRFSPAYSASPYAGKFRSGLPVRVQRDGLTLFRGTTRSFAATAGQHGPREALIRCEDELATLQGHRLSLPLQTDRRAGALIGLILSQVFGGAVASAELRFTGQPAPGETAAANEITYTFVSGTPSAPYQVRIGASLAETADNLIAAINNAEGAGTLYVANNVRPSGLTAAPIPSYLRRVLEDGPVRLYRLGESVGPTAYDSGLNGQHATMTGSVIAPNFPGALPNDPDPAISFSGGTGRISVPTLDLANRSFTVECWILPDAASPPAQQTWFGLYNAPGSAGLVFNCRLLNTGAVQIGWGGADLNLPPGTIPFGVWSHVAVVYDAATDTTTFYRDGAALASGAGGPYTGQNPTIHIAAAGFSAEYWKGRIDEVAIYLRALPADRIACHHAGRDAPTGVLLSANCRGAWANTLPVASGSAAITPSGPTLSGGTDAPVGWTALASGVLNFDTAGDTWTADRTNALSAVSDCAASERGLFWVARDGTLVFQDQAYLLARYAAAPALTLNSEHNALIGAAGAETLYNRVIVRYAPRRRLVSGPVARANGVIAVPGQSGLARWNGTVALPAGGAVTVRLPFADPASGRTVGAERLITPLVPHTDYRASDARDGLSGADYTAFPGLTFSAAASGSEVEISIRNTALGPLYVAGLQVRGVAIIHDERQQVIREDAASQAQHGTRTLTVDLPLGADGRFAESLAAYLLDLYRTPRYRLTAISFAGATAVGGGSLFEREIGDVLAVTDHQTGLVGAKYVILGVAYRIGVGEADRVTFYVRGVDEAAYAIWDTSAAWDASVWGI